MGHGSYVAVFEVEITDIIGSKIRIIHTKFWRNNPIIIGRPLELRHNSFVKIHETRENAPETKPDTEPEE